MTTGTNGPDASNDAGTRPRRRRLSALRVLIALVVAATAATVGAISIGRALEPTVDLPDAWFAPYVDVTLTPLFSFEDRVANPSDDVVLSFVVAADPDTCEPTWGTYATLDEAATTLDLDRRIARYRMFGGDVVVSFGGAANTELAVACSSVDELVGAYRAVVDRYAVTTIDLDIEGPALDDAASILRRGEAVAALQTERRDQGDELAVWLTLPIAADGMLPDSVAVIDAMLGAGVDIAGVNLMTMNYDVGAGTSMAEVTVASLEAAHRQLDAAYRRAELPLTGEQLWRKIGATPMIGRNDVETDVFGLDDAEALVDFAVDSGLGRLSMWSLNRDLPCGPNVDARRTSDHCTGLDQEPLRFAGLLDAFTGRPAAVAGSITVADDSPPVVDDPATSPYPIWRADKGYDEGAKVVWRGFVYQAKWWNQGALPDEPVVSGWETPWSMLGPVMPDDRPPPTPTPMPDGTYPEWSAKRVYVAGDRVLLDGYPYEAKWWTEGDRPDADVQNSWDSPWEPLFDTWG